ncbi:hypothetical protein [Sulfurimonas autotrophica]|uniref:Uncharacterized protein n=1 Tax=Sulfurimonas autotrophica (strain ATCC BAA-671 / DSM 16294 / JCM 11897 / OK10) TaxID=563040 RepID=E0UU17_SULAO|nr:hypothetical protein [Sulfurimonas autotrophica]ADN08326.1 hypothetical protein Saut_0277 [Sulfurimonas autotrophica DSM 16294]
MTIKKIGLSALAVAALYGTVYAGTVTGTNSGTFSLDKIADNNITAAIDINATYTPALNAAISDGTLVVEYTNAYSQNCDANTSELVMYDGTKYVTKANPTCGGTPTGTKLLFDVNNTIADGAHLTLVDKDTNTTSGDLNVSILKGADVASVKFSLVNVNDVTVDPSSGSVTIATGKTEWSAAVGTSFDNQIDAAKSFALFTNSPATNDDNATITFTRTTVDFGGATLDANIKLTTDYNVSSIGSLKFNNVVKTPNGSFVYDVNATGLLAASTDYPIDFDGNTTTTSGTKIDATGFKVAVSAVKLGTAAYSKSYVSASDKNLGEWSVYGYNGYVPNATASTASNIETVLSFTNTSSTTVDAYFTLVAADGTETQVDSVNDGLAKLETKKTVKYNVSDLITTAGVAEGSYMIKVVFPTTPSKIIGFASFRNDNKNAFKDLPIHSNIDASTLQY